MRNRYNKFYFKTSLVACLFSSILYAQAKNNPAKSVDNTTPPKQQKLEINAKKSQVIWKGHKGLNVQFLQYSHEGTIGINKGHIVLNPDDTLRDIFIEMDMTTIKNTDLTGKKNKQLVDHLNNKDFFDVTAFPLASFRSTNIKITSNTNENKTYQVQGNMVIKKITQPITLKLTVVKNNNTYTGTTNLSLDRTKWGIYYKSTKNKKGLSLIKILKDKVIRDSFDLSISIEANKIK